MSYQKRIILASNSPRRKELLKLCNVDFEVEAATIDESMNLDNDLSVEIQQLAIRKAKAVQDKHPDAIVIGSDTIVVIDNEVLGKPKTADKAKEMLAKIQGKTHQVITGCAILDGEKVKTVASISNVTFSKMSDQDIEEYVATKEPLDKAGAYGIQGLGGRYIEKIDGDYYAIMGLPLNWVFYQLKNTSFQY